METYLESICKNAFTQPVIFSPVIAEDLSALSSKVFCMNDSSPSLSSNGIKAMKGKTRKIIKRER